VGHAGEDPDAALRVLDAELESTIERLQRIRGEIALILQHRAAAELPPEFSEVGGQLSEADRSLVMIWSRVFDESAMDDLRTILRDEPRTSDDDAFDALPADADRATRRRLGAALGPAMGRLFESYPWLTDPGDQALHGAESTLGAEGERPQIDVSGWLEVDSGPLAVLGGVAPTPSGQELSCTGLSGPNSDRSGGRRAGRRAHRAEWTEVGPLRGWPGEGGAPAAGAPPPRGLPGSSPRGSARRRAA
jgi:hypothetical protein